MLGTTFVSRKGALLLFKADSDFQRMISSWLACERVSRVKIFVSRGVDATADDNGMDGTKEHETASAPSNDARKVAFGIE